MFADRIFLDHARAEIEFSGARLLGSSVTAGIGTSDISPKTAYCSVMETFTKLCYNDITVHLRWPCTIRRVPWKIAMGYCQSLRQTPEENTRSIKISTIRTGVFQHLHGHASPL